VGPEKASRLRALYARRAGPIGLTVNELDFANFHAKNGFSRIPVKAWIPFPNCAELVDGEVYAWTAKAAEVTWKDGPADLPDLGVEFRGHPPRRNDQELERARRP
jgi:hypothetical protein